MAGSASEGDVTRWLQQLHSSDPIRRADASQKLFERYADLLQRKVRAQVNPAIGGEVDSNLVAAKVLQSFLEQPSSSISNENSLFTWLMQAVAWRRIDAIRKAKKVLHPGKMSLEGASTDDDPENDVSPLDQGFTALPASEPELKRRQEHKDLPPLHYEKGDSSLESADAPTLILLDVDAAASEMLLEMMKNLPKDFEEIAALSIQGDTTAEIARKLSLDIRVVQYTLNDMRQQLKSIMFDSSPISKTGGDDTETSARNPGT